MTVRLLKPLRMAHEVTCAGRYYMPPLMAGRGPLGGIRLYFFTMTVRLLFVFLYYDCPVIDAVICPKRFSC